MAVGANFRGGEWGWMHTERGEVEVEVGAVRYRLGARVGGGLEVELLKPEGGRLGVWRVAPGRVQLELEE